MDVGAFIAQYGYPAVFFGTMLEGEAVVLLAGFAAQRGHLDIPGVAACAFGGSLLTDQVYFQIGRKHGEAWLRRHPSWQKRLAPIRKLADQHQIKLALGFRFAYGIRTITPFALGLSSMSHARFALLNAISAAIWAVVMTLLGYGLGSAVEPLLGDIRRYEATLFIGLAIAGLVWTLLRRRKARSARTDRGLTRTILRSD